MKFLVIFVVLSAPVLAGAQAVPSAMTVSIMQPTVSTQVGVYRFKIGDVQVTALSDGTVPQDFHKLLQGITQKSTDALLMKDFLVNPVQTSINVYLLEIGSRHVLVDTGVGELFGPGNGGRLVGSLQAAGFRPEQIDDILITHVHADHIGGLTLRGQVVFPNATIHVSKSDMQFFFEPAQASAHADAKLSDEAVKMLKAYVDAGKVKTFEGSSQILPCITAIVHPGHTPGSAFYILESQGQKIVFVGDIVHSAAVQFLLPTVSIVYDAEPSLAVDVRKKAFADFTANGTLIAAPHLAFPGVGHIAAATTGYRWIPIEYANWSKPEAP